MRPGATATSRPPLYSIALISAAALAYEILLMRLFSIIQWHHFAYMMISLALLGYGASGTFLAMTRRWQEGRFPVLYIVNAVLFGVGSLVCFMLAQAVPFNALEVLWDPRQAQWLILIFLLLFIPFFCAAMCICLAFSQYGEQLHKIYCFDLLGAGCGAAGIIAVLFVVSPPTALQVVGALGLFSAMVAWWELRLRPRWPLAILLLATGVMLSPGAGIELKVSEFKGLSQALRVLGAEQIDERSSPLGLLTTVRSPTVPYRHSPGLSLNSPTPVPAQLGLFTDADALSVLTEFDGDLEKIAHLDYQSSALAYHLLDRPDVLVLGAGGGADVLQALYHRANRIDAVELNPQIVELVNREFAAFTGAIYELTQVKVYNDEARGFVAASDERYDLIQVALLDSFNASSGGLHSLSENYLYTVEALTQYLGHLRDGGTLSITRWIKTPPRDGLKMMATAIEALRQAGVADPGRQLVMIRSWNTTTLLVGNEAFSERDIGVLKAFYRERRFDPVFYAGMSGDEANSYNQLREAWYYEGAVQLLGQDPARFLHEYKFDVRPATDDRPYFSQFLKWRTLPELLTLRDRGGLPLLEWGYLILVATFALALLMSFLSLILPLWLRHRKKSSGRAERWRYLAYFSAVGMAFMFIEIAFIQKFILFLSHPLYAVAVVLCAFLVFAGMGSLSSARLREVVSMRMIASAIALLCILYLLSFPGLFNWLVQMPDGMKISVSVLLIAPLAFLMGMPFPNGLALLAERTPGWIPWAWGINGCASVVSAILATILAVHFGFMIVVVMAVLLYLLAAMVLREMDAPGSP